MRSPTVAFIGLGAMGLPMARRLALGGFEVHGWSRRRPERLGEEITWRDDGRACVADRDIVVLMLTDAAAVEDVLFSRDFAAAMRPGSIVVGMGTTGVEHARDTAAQLAPLGVSFADAPVSGGTSGANDGNLTIFLGAEASVANALRPALTAMGTPHHLGPVGAGQAAKLANQIIVGVTIAAVAEAMLFAERTGLHPDKLLMALEGGFADSAVLRTHGPRMAARDFSAAGALRLHLKDLKLAEEAWPAGFGDLRHSALVKAGYQSLFDLGEGELDHSAYMRTYG